MIPPESRPPIGGPVDAAQIDWSAVLAKHEHWLRTIVFARLGSAHEVEEVMQEVSLAAVRQQAPLADPSKVAPWLYRLAVTQSLLYRRRQGRRRKLVDRYAQRVRPSEADGRQMEPLGWLLADERRQLVRQALGRLAPREQEILLLKYTQEWNYRELARHLGATESAIETRLHRARGRLRQELAALQVVEVET
jgi:RNA polymerase sigma-70 factor (ECF subfamily)